MSGIRSEIACIQPGSSRIGTFAPVKMRSSPKMTLASVPPAPIRPKSRFASRAWKTSLAMVQNWITTKEPIASTKT